MGLSFVFELRRTLDNFGHRPQTSTMSKPKRASGLSSRTRRGILIIHGPNLDMLGAREPSIYGKESLARINERLTRVAKREGASLETFQSNHEGALIERVHRAKKQDRKSTRLNSSHSQISYAVFCLKKKKKTKMNRMLHI